MLALLHSRFCALIYSLVVICGVLLPENLFAQKQGLIWYMADNAGLDFHHSPPSSLQNGHLFDTEGTTAICDKDGKLLFYAQPHAAWNKANAIMKNGDNLKGGNSSTQGAMILPMPGNDTLYYLFTLDEFQNSLANGLCYSIVNLCDVFGMGGILPDKKNVFLTGSVSEKMAATNDVGGTDFWLVVHKYNSNSFYAYKITKNGIESPVISSIGHKEPWTGSSVVTALGQMKISPDGSKIALATGNSTPNLVELYDFDNNTGKVSNPIQLPSHNADYGISFSPNSQFLYVSNAISINRSKYGIFQYDVTKGDSQSIVSTEYSVTQDLVMSLQLGPDGKIYCLVKGQNDVGLINNPDESGSNCNYSSKAVYIGGPAYYSFPSFIDSYKYPATKPHCNCIFLAEYFCKGDSTTFYLPDSSGVDSIFWNFGDSATGTQNYSREFIPRHVFSDTGAFNVSAKYYKGSVKFSGSKKINIYPKPEIDFSADTIVLYCLDDIYLTAKTKGGLTYIWDSHSVLPLRRNDSTFDLNPTTPPGMIRLTVINAAGCSATDSVYFDNESSSRPKPFLPNDTAVCTVKPFWLRPSVKTLHYLWQDSSTDRNYYVTKPGKYWVRTYNANNTYAPCVWSDTFTIRELMPKIALGNDTTLCEGISYKLHVDTGYKSYRWQDNSTGNDYMVKKAGTYWVQVTNSIGCTASDTIRVKYTPKPTLTHSKDTVLCGNGAAKLWIKAANGSVSWPGGSNDTLIVKKAGTIKIKVYSPCDTLVDSIVVKQLSPQAELGPDTVLCTGETYQLQPDNGKSIGYLWQDGSTQPSYTVSKAGTYWVKVTNGICSITDTVHISYDHVPIIQHSADTTICAGDSVKTWIKVDHGTISWPGGGNDTLEVNQDRIIRIRATSKCGSVRDSIVVKTHKFNFDLGRDTVLCQGQTLTLKGPAGVLGYKWQDGSQDWQYQVKAPGTYWLEVETQCKPVADTIHVKYDKPLAVNLGNDTILCSGETLDLHAGEAASYHWQDGSDGETYHVSKPGIYKVVASNACGKDSASIRVDYESAPYVELGPDTMLCDTQTWRLKAPSGQASIVWQDGSTKPYFDVKAPGLYYVTMSNHCGTYRDSIQVDYEDCRCEVYMPNAFTPNNDFNNDTYKPIGCKLSNYYMAVYNRWGERIYESYDMDKGWDGKFKGADCQEGMYIYIVSGRDTFKRYVFLKGGFYLLR